VGLHFGDDGLVGGAEVIERGRRVCHEFLLDFIRVFSPRIIPVVAGSGDGAATRQLTKGGEGFWGRAHSGSGDGSGDLGVCCGGAALGGWFGLF
jgi:hypothetical protein